MQNKPFILPSKAGNMHRELRKLGIVGRMIDVLTRPDVTPVTSGLAWVTVELVGNHWELKVVFRYERRLGYGQTAVEEAVFPVSTTEPFGPIGAAQPLSEKEVEEILAIAKRYLR
jgi:hypothetical protein